MNMSLAELSLWLHNQKKLLSDIQKGTEKIDLSVMKLKFFQVLLKKKLLFHGPEFYSFLPDCSCSIKHISSGNYT